MGGMLRAVKNKWSDLPREVSDEGDAVDETDTL